MANDIEVIIMALRKEREELHQKIMQLDRIIKRVQDQGNGDEILLPVKPTPKAIAGDNSPFPVTADIKVQILRVLDIVGVAAQLKTIQGEYTRLTGNKYNIREILRSLQKAGLVKIIKTANQGKGFLWVKSDWIENKQLLDKYKPEGFDVLYGTTTLLFE